ncbi:unnamed protein product [Arabidopsis halleri]
MEKMSDLPRELVEEILSRVPVKSMREVRLTCKKWNTLSKHIGKAAAASREGEFLGIVMVKYRGNIYWGATDEELREGVADFLLCFDFTTERFGPHLSLPFRPYDEDDVVTLSAFGEEQLAVLFQPFRSNGMEIWVTTKIEPNAVLWSKFLAFDLRPLNDGSFLIDKEKRDVVVFHEDRDKSVHEIYEFKSNSWRVLDLTDDCYGMQIWVTNKIELNAVSWSKFLAIVDMGVLIDPSFLIHKEKQAVVVFDEHGDLVNHRRDIAYFVGVSGYFRQMDLGEITDRKGLLRACSYVPSSVFF